MFRYFRNVEMQMTSRANKRAHVTITSEHGRVRQRVTRHIYPHVRTYIFFARVHSNSQRNRHMGLVLCARIVSFQERTRPNLVAIGIARNYWCSIRKREKSSGHAKGARIGPKSAI